MNSTTSPWHNEQREMFLDLDRTRIQYIELLAVPPEDAQAVWRPQPDKLNSFDDDVNNPQEIAIVRDESLPVDTCFNVVIDGKATDRGPAWPNDISRSGFGTLLGVGCFGFDDATGMGLGLGELGAGPLGLDGVAWQWQSHEINTGTHTLAINATSHAGTPTAMPLALPDFTINHLPEPVQGLAVDSAFKLSWSPPTNQA